MKEAEARQIVDELQVEFRKENERMHLHPIGPGMVIGRVVFYLALFHKLGLTDSLDYWNSMARASTVEIGGKEMIN